MLTYIKHLNALINIRDISRPLVKTDNLDDVNSLRYCGYSSTLQFALKPGYLAKEADFVRNFNGKSAYLNSCSTHKKVMPRRKQLSYLLQLPEFTFKITKGKRPSLFFTVKPNEYVKMQRNKDTEIFLGKFLSTTMVNDEVIFMYNDGDINNFGSRYKVQIHFYPADKQTYTQEFLDKPGHFKLKIGTPELFEDHKTIGIKIIDKEEAELIEKDGFEYFNVKDNRDTESENTTDTTNLNKEIIKQLPSDDVVEHNETVEEENNEINNKSDENVLENKEYTVETIRPENLHDKFEKLELSDPLKKVIEKFLEEKKEEDSEENEFL